MSFKINTEKMSQLEDMLAGNADAMMTDPHYQFKKPNDTMYIRAYPEVYPMEAVNLQDADGQEELLTILAFEENHEEHKQLFKKIQAISIVPMITPQGKFFLWLAKQKHPSSDKAEHPAHSSSRRCWTEAQKEWTKVYWDPNEKQYVARRDPDCNINNDPIWPTEKWGKPMLEIVEASISAIGNFVTDIEDPRIRQYRFGQ